MPIGKLACIRTPTLTKGREGGGGNECLSRAVEKELSTYYLLWECRLKSLAMYMYTN